MNDMIREISGRAGSVVLRNGGGYEGVASAPAQAPVLLDVLWRRRWTFIVTSLVCVAGAGLYLALATPIYSASSAVMVQQNAPKALADGQSAGPLSETYLQTQADVMRSTPVLSRALDAVPYHSMRTFAKVKGDAVEWLRKGSAFKVDVPRKSDTVVVSMESPDPDEAAAIVNAVVNAYVVEQARQKHATGDEMVRALQKEREELLAKRGGIADGMLEIKRDNGVISFKEDKSNTVIERMTTLSTSLTAAEIAAMELRAQERAVKAALATPATIAALVTAQQAKGRDAGDHEYDELRRQLIQTSLALSSSVPMVGPNHPRVLVLKSAVDALKARLAEKERQIADSMLAEVSARRAVAEEKENGLRGALVAQEGHAMDLTPAAAAYARLETDLDRIQKRCDQIDARISEVTVNDVDSAPLNVQILDAARAPETPIKPSRPLVLGVALMLGAVLGIGLAMLRDWQDTSLRRPDEIVTILGVPVAATIPRISSRLSAVCRGQIVRFDPRSPIAEAYRSVRTALHLGTAGKSRTILLASPAEGDGKSTTASNLAIAFAQAGERTLVIDCDLREPVQHLIFERDGAIGLSNVIAGQAKLKDAIAPTTVANLYLLPCGPVPVNPSELLTSKRFSQLLAALADTFDRIVIDSAPLTVFSDAQILASSADATLLVLRMNQSSRDLGAAAMERLVRANANVAGAVANDAAAGKPYRKYGGAWQYALPANRYLPPAEGAVDRQPAFATARLGKAEGLTIAEPQWSSAAGE